ncbi:MAG: hypothetical protein ACYDH5_02645 [Acidimicrobiales bacterium]
MPVVVVGVVNSFDFARGTGTVVAEGRGTAETEPVGTDLFSGELGFHSTAIADGSRMIDVGARVVFLLRPGHLGRFEASSLRLLPATAPAGSRHQPGPPGNVSS